MAIRGNFCTIDAEARVVNRRAGRIPTETCEKLVAKLRENVKISGVEILVEAVREYRCVVRFRGDGLGDAVCDTDPLSTGLRTIAPKGVGAAAEKTAEIAAEFLRQAKEILKNEHPANYLMMRGFAKFPEIASMEDVYGLKSAAVAVYPMYRGLARLVGMTILEPGKTIADQMEVVKSHWEKYDFFFIHYKYTDSSGEDGDFAQGRDDRGARRRGSQAGRASARRFDRHRRSLDSEPNEIAQLASGPAFVPRSRDRSRRLCRHLRRAPLPPRRTRPNPCQGHHAPRHGPCRPTPKIRRVTTARLGWSSGTAGIKMRNSRCKIRDASFNIFEFCILNFAFLPLNDLYA